MFQTKKPTKNILIAQRAQIKLCGYVSGYYSERQSVGKFKIQKCVEGLQYLEDKIQDWSASSQAQSVTRRMLSDLECRGVLRTAQETVNLAAKSSVADPLAVQERIFSWKPLCLSLRC